MRYTRAQNIGLNPLEMRYIPSLVQNQSALCIFYAFGCEVFREYPTFFTKRPPRRYALLAVEPALSGASKRALG